MPEFDPASRALGPHDIRFIDTPAIEATADMQKIIALMERTFTDYSLGRTEELDRQSIALVPNDGGNRRLFAMGASTPVGTCVKVLIDTRESELDQGVPAQLSLICVIDQDSGKIRGLCEGRTVTAYRTAAVSALATSYLARRDSRVLALVGAGNLARLHVIALSSVFDIEEIAVWSRTAKTVDAFRDWASRRGHAVTSFETPAECVARADIVCTLTPSRDPYDFGTSIRAGTHINAVGAPPRPMYREVASDLVAQSRIVVDSLQVALREADEILIPLAEGFIRADGLTELADIVAGTAVGRSSPDQITLFKSTGLAIEDAATAQWLVDREEARPSTAGAPTTAKRRGQLEHM